MAKAKIEKINSVLFVASESNPFAGTGGLADVIGSLPKALAKDSDYDVRVVMPLYKNFSTIYRDKLKFLCNFNVPLSWRNLYCGVFTYKLDGVTFYFLDNEYYFKRDGYYGYFDDGERFAFFSKAVLVMLHVIDYYPSVMHCNDWQSALAVIYLKTIFDNDENYRKIKAIYTIHNIEYQGKYGREILGDVFGLPDEYVNIVDYDGCVNLMKGAIVTADVVTTVSPSYAKEIQDDFFSHGLSIITRMFAFKTRGILNGIDVGLLNPKTDNRLFKNYDLKDMSGKEVCKEELQRLLNLPIKKDVPIIAMITRLTGHKGLDLVKDVIDDILAQDVQFVVLGTGETQYEEFFTYIQNKYPTKCKVMIVFNRDLSSKIYSGADMFLMPSKQEPCGLSQMVACRYGTIPIVRRTGGLQDSIRAINNGEKDGNGYKFGEYNSQEMLYVISDALNTYMNDKAKWAKIVKNAMKSNFSWKKSAEEYTKMYNELLGVVDAE